ncbi:hypothetical protein NL676_035860 [Syzygium grande]|nr:hypothetical protein NL676_035860 [Syzygium grande]
MEQRGRETMEGEGDAQRGELCQTARVVEIGLAMGGGLVTAKRLAMMSCGTEASRRNVSRVSERCNGSCEYTDLFPACRYDEFKNAQRLFGVGNIHNIIRVVDPKMRKEAAESILTEGNIRRGNPVHGCLGVAWRLKREIEICKKQLEDANRCLSFFQQRGQESKRQRRCFDDALVELRPLPPSFFSNGGGSGSFYHVIQSNPWLRPPLKIPQPQQPVIAYSYSLHPSLSELFKLDTVVQVDRDCRAELDMRRSLTLISKFEVLATSTAQWLTSKLQADLGPNGVEPERHSGDCLNLGP